MSAKRVAILISGGGTNMAALVDSMIGDHPARPALVISNRPGVGGLDRAAERGVPAQVVDHKPFGKDRAGFEAALTQALEEVDPDIICLAGFMRVLTEEFVDRWAGRILNVHPSLLPKHKGLDTYARALAAGDGEYGATVHLVTPALDDGPILGQVRLAVEPGDTAEAMAARLSPWEHKLYAQVLRRFAEGARDPLYLP